MGFLNYLKAKRYLFQKDLRSKKILKGIKQFIKSNPPLDDDLLGALTFYQNHPLQTFPYNFPEKYRNQELSIILEGNTFFTLINGNKMYFRSDWSESSCFAYLRTLTIEQDIESPHSYCSENFFVSEEDVLIDVGAAEGYFTFLHYPKFKKAYAFEINTKWIEVLKKGFEHDPQKLNLFSGRLGNKSTSGNYRLDDFPELLNESLFIKIDVEGSEESVFDGMLNLLKSNPKIKIAVCTYHKHDDAVKFQTFLEKRGFSTAFSQGYMLYQFAKDINPPYLRKGVLRAWKQN